MRLAKYVIGAAGHELETVEDYRQMTEALKDSLLHNEKFKVILFTIMFDI